MKPASRPPPSSSPSKTSPASSSGSSSSSPSSSTDPSSSAASNWGETTHNFKCFLESPQRKVLISFFSLVLWGASRNQKPIVTVKSISFNQFLVQAGNDFSGVATNMVTMRACLVGARFRLGGGECLSSGGGSGGCAGGVSGDGLRYCEEAQECKSLCC